MIEKFVLDNGIRIVCEKIPYLRSVSLGVWVGTGSRNEDKTNNGISHLIEHMLFKGTKNRTAKDIAAAIDSIGGLINASTGKEYTCYYTKTLDTHIDVAVDVLADMFFNSLFNEKDINIEKQVVLEEINMYEDTPDDLVHDILAEVMWNGDALGYPILGTYESLGRLNRQTITDYLSNYYFPENTVIAIAGNYDDKKIKELLEKYFSSWKNDKHKIVNYDTVNYNSGVKAKSKDTEQVHLCIGYKGIEYGNDDIYPLLIINNILGGGMSSRLFQKIREEKGLVYSIYSYPSSYRNAGAFTIYAGMKPEQFKEVSRLIMHEIKEMLHSGISQDEMEKAKEQLKGNYMLGLESTYSRMTSLGKSELILGRVTTPEEFISKIDQVTVDKVQSIIEQVFNIEKPCFVAVGKIKDDTDLMSYIEI